MTHILNHIVLHFQLEEDIAELQNPKMFTVDSHDANYVIFRNLSLSYTSSSVFQEHCLGSIVSKMLCHLANSCS